MTTNKFLTLKTEDLYISKLTHDTIIFGENLFKIISGTFTSNRSATLYEHTDDNTESISFCSELLPFYCKSEVIHQGDVFNVRFGHSCIFYKNTIYIYGGNQHVETFNSKLIQFNTDTNVFKIVDANKSPQSRYYASLDLIYSTEQNEDCLFLFGGKRGKYITNDTFMYHINSNTWEHVKMQFSPPPLFGHVSFKYKNIIFIHGGNMGNLSVSSDIWSYFEEEKKWVKIMSKDEYYNKSAYKPSGRFFHSCSVCVSNQGNDVKAYIFGGLNDTNKCAEDLFWSYSLNNGKWKKIDNSFGKIPIQRYGYKNKFCSRSTRRTTNHSYLITSTVLNDRWFLLCGGYNFSWHSRPQLLDLYAYDISLNTWSNLNVYGMTLVTHHFYGNLIQVDESGYFFIFGGLRNNEASCKIYKFTPLVVSPFFNVLKDKINEMKKSVHYLENNPRKSLNPTYSKDINEIKNSLSGISFTLVRYVQLINDLNEKIKISNELAKNNYSYLSEKLEHDNSYFDSLVKRIQQLDSPSSDTKEESLKSNFFPHDINKIGGKGTNKKIYETLNDWNVTMCYQILIGTI
ncbi:kelch domain-containing protein [Plasmodium ovale curtisi]|uniref:Kelch domain-containing protein n=1 Tax=Plasmodium ovale curtisi TaxID=864141 RepID=A0A1A8WE20_PLAOA|nr:kelch domain-containing protein [Plasmodium ovale curtisi]